MSRMFTTNVKLIKATSLSTLILFISEISFEKCVLFLPALRQQTWMASDSTHF